VHTVHAAHLKHSHLGGTGGPPTRLAAVLEPCALNAACRGALTCMSCRRHWASMAVSTELAQQGVVCCRMCARKPCRSRTLHSVTRCTQTPVGCPDEVLDSPLSRTAESAQVMQALPCLPFFTDPCLCSTMRYNASQRGKLLSGGSC